MEGKFVGYYRVSTRHQGLDGLGMEAQKRSVAAYLNGGNWVLLAEFSEVETGKKRERPELQKAISLCLKEGATLLIAKLDRLARNAAFLLNLMESGVKFRAVDMPTADNFTIGILAMVAEKEALDISVRTKAGLMSARNRGAKLGNPNITAAGIAGRKARTIAAKDFAEKLRPVFDELKKAHVKSLRGFAECLNRRGFKTAHGKLFAPQTVRNILKLLEMNSV